MNPETVSENCEPALQVVSGSSGKLVWQLPLPEDWSDMTVSLAADTETAALYVAALGARYATTFNLLIERRCCLELGCATENNPMPSRRDLYGCAARALV